MFYFFFLVRRATPEPKRTYTPFPYTTLFRSGPGLHALLEGLPGALSVLRQELPLPDEEQRFGPRLGLPPRGRLRRRHQPGFGKLVRQVERQREQEIGRAHV